MRILALALILLAGAAALASGVRKPVGQRVRTSTVGSAIAGSQLGPAAFEFATGAGGLPGAAELCSVLEAADKVGAWECYEGDNSSVGWDGGSSIWGSAGGSPAAQTMSLCPNGAGCANVTRDVENANDGRKSAEFASGTGSVSACWLGIIEAVANYPLLTHSTGGATATISWYLEATSGAAGRLYISDGSTQASATSTGIGGAGYLAGGEHFFCGTWSAATGIVAYLDGVASSPVARAARQSLSAAPTIHGVNGGTLGQPRIRTRGAFFTQTELTAGRIAAITRAVLADTPTGSKGEAMAFTRATASSCPLNASESEVTDLPHSRPCVNQFGHRWARGYVQYTLRTNEFDNVGWNKLGLGGSAAPTVTANSVDCGAAPNGSMTADKVEFPAVGAASASLLEQHPGAIAAAAFTRSVYAKTLSGDGKLGTMIWNATNGYVANTQHTATAGWTRLYTPNVTIGNSDTFIYIGNDTRVANFNMPTTAGTTVCLWRDNFTQTAYPVPSVDATSATVTVNGETNAVNLESLRTTVGAEGCAAATVTTFHSQALTPGGHSIVLFEGGARALYLNSTTLRVYDTSTEITTPSGLVAMTARRFYSFWKAGASASSLNGEVAWTLDGNGMNNGSSWSTAGIGYHGTFAQALDGYVKNVVVDGTTGRCR